MGALCCVFLCGCGAKSDPGETPPPDIQTPPAEPQQPTLPTGPTEPQAPALPTEPQQPTLPEPTEPSAPEPSVPEPAVRVDTLLVSTVNGLRVRAGKGTNYAVLGALDKGDMAQPVERSGEWYKVRYRNTVGYVSRAYVTTATFAQGSEPIERVIGEGKKLLGLPYVFGAQRYHWGNGVKNTAYTGDSYDCSSLMQYIFKIGANIDLAMTSREQSVQGRAVSRQDIRRGDLLFFTNASRVNKTGIERIGHVALYLGDNIILHTASDHAVIEPISATRWGYYISARRVL